jgi:GR25 family glycosyltransferase involved in LPS biosynthesis
MMKKFFENTPVYIINLKDSVVRRNKIIDQLGDYEKLTIVDAVDGRNPTSFRERYRVKYTQAQNFTTALIAATCSYIKAIKMAYDNNDEYACILEDDTSFDLLDRAEYTIEDLKKMNQDWEAIQLYYSVGTEKYTSDYLKNGLRLIRRQGDEAGVSFLINRKGMEKLLTNTFVTNGTDEFTIFKMVISPENLLLDSITTYVINLPSIYNYEDGGTFEEYVLGERGNRISCLNIHINSANYLINFYKKFLNKSSIL